MLTMKLYNTSACMCEFTAAICKLSALKDPSSGLCGDLNVKETQKRGGVDMKL